MVERQGFTGGQLLVAAAAGAVIGAVAALLLAPKTGAELRSRIKDLAATSKEKVSRVPKAFGDATEAARDAFVTTLER
ncbi:MAG TPA: YtxH domain-containing protein [Candidatus Polarisedimenticolaceae bacterium]|nr:YtxH domain-containing protein [Candidatus Polarisedimenticolaceae bacterium]